MTCQIFKANYKISCQFQNSFLRLTVQPLQIIDQSLNYRIYESQYSNETIPQCLKHVFLSSAQNWYKYIDFSKNKCLDIDLEIIRQDQYGTQCQQQYLQIPITFQLFIFQGIQSLKTRLYGKKSMYSKQKLYENLLKKKQQENQNLKSLLQEKDQTIKVLKQKIQQFKMVNENLHHQIQKLQSKQSKQLPRKKIHLKEQIQQIQNPYPQNSVNQSSNLKVIESAIGQIQNNFVEKNKQSPQQQPQQENKLNSDKKPQQKPKDQLIDLQTESHSNRVDKLSINNQEHKQNYKSSHSSSLYNQKTIKDSQQNHNEDRKSQSFDHLIDNYTVQRTQIRQKILQPTNTTPLNTVLSEQNRQQIKIFAEQKCFLDVGFDEKGVRKYGFCCPYCEKVFKECDYLWKHFTIKHSSQITNNTTYEELMNQLNYFKRRKQQKLKLAENNSEREKHFNKSNEFIGRTGTR